MYMNSFFEYSHAPVILENNVALRFWAKKHFYVEHVQLEVAFKCYILTGQSPSKIPQGKQLFKAILLQKCKENYIFFTSFHSFPY